MEQVSDDVNMLTFDKLMLVVIRVTIKEFSNKR